MTTKAMTTKQIIEYLRHYNEWRRGNDAPQPNPTEVGKTIDAACHALRTLERERDEAREELENYRALSIHTCGPDCRRPMCVLRRERDEARKELKAWKEARSE